MASLKLLKKRINSISNSIKITGALNLISTSKFQKAKNQLEEYRSYFDKMKNLIFEIVNSADIENEFVDARDSNKILYIVFTSDKGFCGPYNLNILKQIQKIDKSKENLFYLIGNKLKDEFVTVGEDNEFNKETGSKIIDIYLNQNISQVYIIYTKFLSILRQEVIMERILPLQINRTDYKIQGTDIEDRINETGYKINKTDNKIWRTGLLYEPDLKSILDNIIPIYINELIKTYWEESNTSLQVARMLAMQQSTKNGKELITTLNLKYNKIRQNEITQELTEIISGGLT